MHRHRLRAGAGLAAICAICACTETPPQRLTPDQTWRPAFDVMTRNAAVRDQTLHDPHFEAGGGALSAAGRERLIHLVRCTHPDVPYVFVARDWTHAALTQTRLESVRAALADLGQPSLAVRAADVPMRGMSGEEAVISVDNMVDAYRQNRTGAAAESTTAATTGGAGQSGPP